MLLLLLLSYKDDVTSCRNLAFVKVQHRCKDCKVGNREAALIQNTFHCLVCLLQYYYRRSSTATEQQRETDNSRFFLENHHHTTRILESDSRSNESYESVLSSKPSKMILNQITLKSRLFVMNQKHTTFVIRKNPHVTFVGYSLPELRSYKLQSKKELQNINMSISLALVLVLGWFHFPGRSTLPLYAL